MERTYAEPWTDVTTYRAGLDIDGEAFREGDVVTYLDVHETCNHCYQCLVAKQPTRCPSRKVYGITYS